MLSEYFYKFSEINIDLSLFVESISQFRTLEDFPQRVLISNKSLGRIFKYKLHASII